MMGTGPTGTDVLLCSLYILSANKQMEKDVFPYVTNRDIWNYVVERYFCVENCSVVGSLHSVFSGMEY